MKREDVEYLIDRLRSKEGRYGRIGYFVIHEGESDRYADYIADNLESYLSEDYSSPEAILEDVKEEFEDMDDSTWMFDDEENEENNEIW